MTPHVAPASDHAALRDLYRRMIRRATAPRVLRNGQVTYRVKPMVDEA